METGRAKALSLVIDASVALAWCLPGEATVRTEALLDRVTETDAVASAIWPIEIANILLMSERSGRTTLAATLASVQFLSGLQVLLDFEVVSGAFSSVVALARAHNLTVYDATYLELALRRQLPLATDDVPLRTAAERAGVEIL